MTFEEIKALDHQYVMQSYGRFDVAVDHGRGATLWHTHGPGQDTSTSPPASACAPWATPTRAG